jgi:hypothetical protein
MAIEDTRSEETVGWHDGSWLKKTMQMQAEDEPAGVPYIPITNREPTAYMAGRLEPWWTPGHGRCQQQAGGLSISRRTSAHFG